MDASGVIVEYVEAQVWCASSRTIMTGINCPTANSVVKRSATGDAWLPIVAPVDEPVNSDLGFFVPVGFCLEGYLADFEAAPFGLGLFFALRFCFLYGLLTLFIPFLHAEHCSVLWTAPPLVEAARMEPFSAYFTAPPRCLCHHRPPSSVPLWPRPSFLANQPISVRQPSRW